MIKVTPQMGSRWVKGAFLALLGIIILIYADPFVEDLKTNLQDDISFDATWDLLRILLWVLVAWLFVDAALTIALSFSMHKYSLDDVMKRLLKIEKRLGIEEAKSIAKAEEETKTVVTEEELPPPPPPARE